jgi:LacI family transcriptional regulator
MKRIELANQMADKVGSMICEKNWPVGIPLPSTRALAQEYGVSVPTAQKAIRHLAKTGMVELRSRQGAFVKRNLPERSGSRAGSHIGVVFWRIPEELSLYPMGIAPDYFLRGINQGLTQAGYHTTLLSYDQNSPDIAEQVFQQIDRFGPGLKGLITYSRPEALPLIDKLESRSIPWVSINAPGVGSMYNFVSADNHEGGWRLGQVLVKQGIRRVLCLHTRQSSSGGIETISGLYRGYLEGFAPTDQIQLLGIESGKRGEEQTAFQATCDYLNTTSDLPEVIFATGDYIAMGAIRACKEKGIRIPDDIGVVSGTGFDFTASVDPPLTVLAEPVLEIGRQAGIMLLDMLRQGVRKMMGRRIPCPLVFRDSFRVSDALKAEMEGLYQKQFREYSEPAGYSAVRAGP